MHSGWIRRPGYRSVRRIQHAILVYGHLDAGGHKATEWMRTF